MTKAAVIVLSEEGILIVAIPPLSHQPPDFFGDNPTLPTLTPPPLFTIKFPGESELRPDQEWKIVSSWYFGSPDHLYFDMLSNDVSNKPYRFKIELKPDLSTASLHTIYNPGLTPLSLDVDAYFDGYKICEDTLVSFWLYDDEEEAHHCEIYTESTSACFDNAISHSRPAAKMLLPDIGRDSEYVLYPCPASGRFVRLDSNNKVAVLDFL